MHGVRLVMTLGLLGALAAASCQSDDVNPPPPAGPGGSSGWVPQPPLGGGGGMVEGDGDGDGDGDTDPPINLLVSLSKYNNARLTGISAYTEPSVVSQLAPGGSELGRETIEGGMGTLELTDGAQPYWVFVLPEDDDTVLPAVIPNGRAVEHSSFDLEKITLMPEEVLLEILGTTSENPTPGGAHLLMRFLSAEGELLEGVSVEYVEGGISRTFASELTWDESRTSSDEEGLVLYYNIQSAFYPGQLHDVHLRGAIDGEFQVQLVFGAVTIATFRQEL